MTGAEVGSGSNYGDTEQAAQRHPRMNTVRTGGEPTDRSLQLLRLHGCWLCQNLRWLSGRNRKSRFVSVLFQERVGGRSTPKFATTIVNKADAATQCLWVLACIELLSIARSLACGPKRVFVDSTGSRQTFLGRVRRSWILPRQSQCRAARSRQGIRWWHSPSPQRSCRPLRFYGVGFGIGAAWAVLVWNVG